MARRRRKEHTEPAPLERWLVSYADFITLLFAFFVVMYAISTVNEGKYRVLSETLGKVFAVEDGRPLPVSPAQGSMSAAPAGGQENLPMTSKAGPAAATTPGDSAGDVPFADLVSQLQVSLSDLAGQGLVSVSVEGGDRVVVHMQSQMLFDSGDARLSPRALQALQAVAKVLDGVPYPVRVEGHTDNRPISTLQFPSNWELSAARAASVVNYLARSGIAPTRMSAVGYGEFRPKADNRTEQGRAMNRRVTLVVLAGMRPADQPGDAVPWAEGPGLEE
jgi:chemotaxis protein MotB